MSLENILFDVTITIIDKDTEEKAGQFRYHFNDTDVEIFDTYLFPEYRRKKIMSSLFKKIVSHLKLSGASKIRLKHFDDDARLAWERMGFKVIDEKGHMELCLEDEN